MRESLPPARPVGGRQEVLDGRPRLEPRAGDGARVHVGERRRHERRRAPLLLARDPPADRELLRGGIAWFVKTFRDKAEKPTVSTEIDGDVGGSIYTAGGDQHIGLGGIEVAEIIRAALGDKRLEVATLGEEKRRLEQRLEAAIRRVQAAERAGNAAASSVLDSLRSNGDTEGLLKILLSSRVANEVERLQLNLKQA